MTQDPRIDAYIAAREPFARPILAHVRAIAHAAVPDLVETLKWGMPSFTLNGKLVLGLAAFKAHAALNFWHGELVTGAARSGEAMGDFGRITSLADLPDDAALKAMIVKAADLVHQGVKAPHTERQQKRAALPVPPALAETLAANPEASVVWDAFSDSARRDYCEWIGEAKRPETAAKRTAEAIGWIAEGKKRHWKYENC